MHTEHQSPRADIPDCRDLLNMTLKPPHHALRLKVEDRDYPVRAADCEEVPCEQPAGVELGARRFSLDRGLVRLGEILRERICGGRGVVRAEAVGLA